MRYKYRSFIPAALMAMLACNTITSPFTTPAPLPTVIRSIEIPYATVEYYEVSGSTARELRDRMNALSSIDDNGYRGDALTSWEIHWNWKGYGTETCDLSSVTATYEIQVRLPRWTPPQDASPALIAKWNAYTLALVEHEKGHVNDVVESLPNLIKTIRAATCTTAEGRAQEVLSQLSADILKYDEETDHGAAQGAIFP